MLQESDCYYLIRSASVLDSSYRLPSAIAQRQRHVFTLSEGRSPGTGTQIVVQIVYSSQDRVPNLDPYISPEHYAYLTSIIRKRGHTPIFVGGHRDHVHLLLGLSRVETVAILVEHTKTETSKWLKTTGPSRRDFSWQSGYGAFGISYFLCTFL